MSLFASWRTALRIARREARRTKGRSILVLAMIAVPVLGLSFAAVSYDMFRLTGAERADRTMGTADARVHWPQPGPIEQDPLGEWYTSTRVFTGDTPPRPGTESELRAELPAGSTLLPTRRGSIAMKTVNGVGRPNAISVDATHPLTRGYVEILEGRAPQTATEVALTEQAVARLGAGLGGTVTTANGRQTYTVVGVAEFPSLLEEVVLLAPIAGNPPEDVTLDQQWLVDTPAAVDWAGVGRLNQLGIVVASREVFINPPPADLLANFQFGPSIVSPDMLAVGVLVGGIGLLEIILMAGPAFAISARRRQRQVALVAANGGTPAHVRRVVLADGIVLGAAGAVAGIGLGIATAFVARPYLEEMLIHARAGGYRIYPLALAAIAALAVVTGVLAAMVPAFVTARQNVVAALAGRRGVTKSKKRWIVVGLTMLAAGAGVGYAGITATSAELILIGVIVGELGLVLCTPALVGLVARLGQVLPLAPRIALRDAARNRAAAAPAISAVMAAVAGSVAIGIYFETDRQMQLAFQQPTTPPGHATVWFGVQDPGNSVAPPSQESIEAVIRSSLPVDEIHPVSTITCADSRWCSLEADFAPSKRCPFLLDIAQPRSDLTPAEVRTAKADPRCSDVAMFGLATNALIDDGTALAALSGASGDDLAQAVATLRAGGVVVRDERLIENGRVSFHKIDVDLTKTTTEDPRLSGGKVSFPAYLLTTGVTGLAPIVSPGALVTTGLTARPTGLIVATTRMPTVAERDRFDAGLLTLETSGFIQPEPRLEIRPEVLFLIAAAGVITLGAAGIGTGLAAADGRADLSTLAAVGASPRLRRGLSLSQSSVIAGLGSVLGAAAGLSTATAVTLATNEAFVDAWPSPPPIPVIVPWLSLAAAVLVVPAIAIGGAGLLTRSRLPIERRL